MSDLVSAFHRQNKKIERTELKVAIPFDIFQTNASTVIVWRATPGASRKQEQQQEENRHFNCTYFTNLEEYHQQKQSSNTPNFLLKWRWHTIYCLSFRPTFLSVESFVWINGPRATTTI